MNLVNLSAKKIMIVFLMGIILISTVSAMEWDNIKSYDTETKTYTITNALGLGETISKIKLTTPISNNVGIGYVKVFEMNIESFDDYQNAIQNMDFYNINDKMKSIEIDFDYKWKNITIIKGIERVCSYDNKTNESTCRDIPYEYEKIQWEDYNEKDMLKGNITISGWTTTKAGDKIEWIPTYFGERLTEWASWTAGLNSNINLYYKLNESSGDLQEAVGDRLNLKAVSSPVYNQTDGIINASVGGNSDNDCFQNETQAKIGQYANFSTTDDFSINMWIRYYGDGTDQDVGFASSGTVNSGGTVRDNSYTFSMFNDGDCKGQWNIWDGVAGSRFWIPITGVCDDAWHMVTFTREDSGTNLSSYVDGVLQNNTGITVLRSANATNFTIGGDPLNGRDWNGLIDEFGLWSRKLSQAEVTQLYNGGNGITYASFFDTAPIVTLNNPIDNYNTTASNFDFNCTVIDYDDTSPLENISFYMNGTLITTNSSPVNDTLTNFNINLVEGNNQEWSCYACDNSSRCNFAGTNRTVNIDMTNPSLLLFSPSGIYDYYLNDMNVSLNWSANDSNIDTCWYQYAGTNTTVTCSDNTTKITITGDNYKDIIFYVNDSVGHINTSSTSWDYYIFENSLTYDDSVLEGKTSEFIINFTYRSSYTPSGSLIYNGTSYPATRQGTGNTILLRRNITAPAVDITSNVTFNWSIGLTNVTGTYYFNSSTFNQTINNINMSETGDPYDTAFINFTSYDEETLEEINATFESTFTYRIQGGSVDSIFSFSDTSENNSRWSFAFDPNDEIYTVDVVLEIDANGYTHRFYNFQGIEFTNTTTEIGLYLLNESSSSSFIISLKDSSYVPLEGMEVYIQRFYPSINAWYTMEIAETNEDGETAGHLLTEDAIYRFKIYDDGDLLYTTDETIIICSAVPCTIEIIIPEDLDDAFEEFEDLDDLDSEITYDDSTEDITYEYSDTSGEFEQGRLYVIRIHPGNSSIEHICNLTSSGSAAVLICDLTGEENGTYIASGYITRTEERLVEREIFNKIRDIVNTISLDGVLWSMFLLIGIIMLGVYRPSLGIIFGAGGVVLLWALQLMEITITAIISIIGIAIILLVGVNKQ